MSSNIRIPRICNLCKQEFIAKTTVTQYCSDKCAKKAYKIRKRNLSISNSLEETIELKTYPIREAQTKEFLTPKEASLLLSCSVKTVYRLIENGTLKATNLAERMTRIKRENLDNLIS